MADLSELIEAYVNAKAVFDAADENNDDAEWAVCHAAELAIVVFPCRSLQDVRVKSRFFLENESPYDTLRNCHHANEETLMPFLRSLLVEASNVPPDERPRRARRSPAEWVLLISLSAMSIYIVWVTIYILWVVMTREGP